MRGGQRGGRRAGKLAGKYPNRTDLAAKTKLPVTVGPSQYYGQATASAAAQKAVPEGNPAVAPPMSSGAAPTGWQPGMPPPAALSNTGINPLHAPTQRPNEPLTAGLSSGAGPGPEALGPVPFKPDPLVQAAASFQAVPTSHMTPQMRALALATQASASNASLPGIAQGAQ